MTRFGLLLSEPLRERMAGIGIRYVEMARHLKARGLDVVLIAPAPEGEPGLERVRCAQGDIEVVPFDAEQAEWLHAVKTCRAVLAQGQLANDLLLAEPGIPVAIDLYDPWLVENMHYFESLGLDPFRNDHATWVLQMARGDFFVCSSLEQRLFYLGFLTALGRVHPERLARDPTLASLIGIVPFGTPQSVGDHVPWLDAPAEDAPARLLFGGLYDWYDPMTVLDAVSKLSSKRPCELLIIRSANQASTPQRKLEQVEQRLARDKDLARSVRFLDWIPWERRYDLLRDVDLMVTAHEAGLETDLSLRTRFLDALVVGCPIVVTRGGALGRLLTQHEAGWCVPERDPVALEQVLEVVLTDSAQRDRRTANARELAKEMHWPLVIEPLVRFAEQGTVDASRERFGVGLAGAGPNRIPQDDALFRVKRFIKRHIS